MASSPGRELLAHDREQLDRVVRLVQSGRPGFLVITCPQALWPRALDYIHGQCPSGVERRVPPPEAPLSDDQLVDRLTSIQHSSQAVLSVGLTNPPISFWTALNWHREKLRRGGRVLLWLDSTADLQNFREHAPDAYSFRDAVLVIEGDGQPSYEPDTEDTPQIKSQRILFELPRTAVERAEAARDLAQTLYETGRFDEAIQIAQTGLDLVSSPDLTDTRARRARVRLYQELAESASASGRSVHTYRFCRWGLMELGDDLVTSFPDLNLWFEMMSGDAWPYHLGAKAASKVAHWPFSDGGEMPGVAHVFLGASAFQRGHFKAALDHFNEALHSPQSKVFYKSNLRSQRAQIQIRTGNLKAVAVELTEAEKAALRSQAQTSDFLFGKVRLFVARGELDAAERLYN
ncbi:MAG: tetratricopeptide repeat protein [Polyangiaceae bacterium]|nr:tetratricopeptide repeat protein [Polyangiaceae bacterium]